MGITKKKEDTQNAIIADLQERLQAVEHEMQAVKDGLAFHENRLNNLSLSSETVDVIATRTVRSLGQLLVTITEPEQQQQATTDNVETLPEKALKEA